MFANCSGECAVCACAGFCLAGNGDDDFCPATKEQIIERLRAGLYSNYHGLMVDYLRTQYGYFFDPKDIGTLKGTENRPAIPEPPTDEEVSKMMAEVFGGTEADESQMATPEYVDRMVFEANPPKLPCLICGEDVPLKFEERDCNAKVCDRCKAAVMKVRQGIEEPYKMIMD